jgi:beta-xylosidase
MWPSIDIVNGCTLERPKVIYNAKTNKFVMWFHIEKKNKGYAYAHSGVAIASKATGPYTFLKSIRSCPGAWPVNVQDCHKKPVSAIVMATYYPGGGFPKHPDSLNILGKFYHEGQMERDMTLFVDDDSKAYHIYASEYNSTIQIAELTDDYLDHTGKYVRAFVARWMEAPAIFKHNGLYYFIGSGCTGWAPNAARSAVSPSIWGPWTETGNPCVGKDAELTFHSQSTYVLPVVGKKDAFIFIADRWNADNAIDGRYIWLPIRFKDGKIQIEWHDQWDLDLFNKL